MSALTSLLVRDDVISPQTVEDALQRQTLAGGEIDTALLELGVVSENVLSAYRAAIFGLRPACREDVMHVSDDTLKMLSVEWAHRLRVVPLMRAGGTLVVCAAAPLAAAQQRALEDVAGSAIEVRIAVQVRVEAALAIFYGVQIAQRMRLLAERLDNTSSGVPPEVVPLQAAAPADLSQAADAPTSWNPPPQHRICSAPPGASGQVADTLASAVSNMASHWTSIPSTLHSWSYPVRSTSSPSAPLSAGPMARGSVPAGDGVYSGWPSKPPRRSRVPKGPFSAAAAHELLGDVTDRDEIVEVFFAFSRQYFDAAVCFALRHGQLYGLRAQGALTERALGVTLPVMEQGAVGDVLRSLLPRIVSLNKVADDRALALALNRTAAQPAFLLPIPIRQRAVLLLYGDRDGEPFALDEMGPVLGMVPETVQALTQVIRQRKTHSLPAFSARPASSGTPSQRPPAQRSVPYTERASVPPGEQGLATAETHVMPSVGDMVSPTARDSANARAAARESVRAGVTGRQSTRARPASAQSSAALSTLGLSRPVPSVPVIEAQQRDLRADAVAGVHGGRDGAGALAAWAASPSGLPAWAGPPSSFPPPASAALQNAATLSFPPPAATGVADVAALLSPPPPRIDGLGGTATGGASTGGTATGGASEQARDREQASSRRGAYMSVRPGTADLVDPVAVRESQRPPRRSSMPPGGLDGRNASRPSATAVHSSRPPATAVHSSRPPALHAVRAVGQASAGRAAVAADVPEVVAPSMPEVTSLSPPEADLANASTTQLASTTQPAAGSALVPVGRRDTAKAYGLMVRSPSIIIDLGKDVAAAVEELAGCRLDEEGAALTAVLRLGEIALPTLAERFPGPLWFERDDPQQRLPQGGDVSAIARALLAFGGRAVPFVADLLAAADPDIRFYALLVALERVDVRYLSPYVELAFDPDPQIRLLVRDALYHYCGKPETEPAVRRLCESAQNAQATLMERLDAIEALSAMREPSALSVLADLNEFEERQLAVPAHRALMWITGRDHGQSTRSWRDFIKEWRGRHRVEWLIAGLTQNDERMRGTCGVELQRLTRQYFGYVAGAPKRDRERIQRRYWEWWEGPGGRKMRPR